MITCLHDNALKILVLKKIKDEDISRTQYR